jgi:type II secretory pathway pseudopilin PulG
MRNKKQDGFTRVELLACVGGFVLLLAVITPALANSRSRSDRIACLSNLRHIGNALRQFALENHDYPPWRAFTPAGNYNEVGKHDLWFQYWWLRDTIGSPKYLMDPGETRVTARVALAWDLRPGGLQALKNNGVAYVLGLDSATFLPRTIMVADRHMVNAGYGGCSSGISTAARISTLPGSQTRWNGEVHGEFGNLALADGSVESVDSDGLRRTVGEVRENGADVHMMMPQW